MQLPSAHGAARAHLTGGDGQDVAHALLLDPACRLDLRVGPGAAVAGEGADDDLFEEGDPGEQEPRHALRQRGASWEPESLATPFPGAPVPAGGPRAPPPPRHPKAPGRPRLPPPASAPPGAAGRSFPSPQPPPPPLTSPTPVPGSGPGPAGPCNRPRRPLRPCPRPARPAHVAVAVHAQRLDLGRPLLAVLGAEGPEQGGPVRRLHRPQRRHDAAAAGAAT